MGIANTLFGIGIMFLFYNVFRLSYCVSSASNYIFGSILSYFLNKHFTFQSRDNSPKGVLQFVVNITVCYLVAYGGTQPLVGYLFSGLEETVRDNLAILAGMCIFVVLNYCGQRFFVFRKTDDSGEK